MGVGREADRTLKRFWTHPVVVLVARLILGGAFIYASLSKIAHPLEFAYAVESYRILPGPLINLFALFLPWLEFIAGVLVVIGVMRSASGLVLGSLLMVFLVAIGVNIIRGADIACGCFDLEKGSPIGVDTLLRDLGLLVCVPPVVFSPRDPFSLSQWGKGR